jgi:subtilisin family serine protease
MTKKLIIFICLKILCFWYYPLHSQVAKLAETPWNFLDTKTIGAHSFLKSHPTYDGRGVVLVICDSGIDMAIPGLKKTSTGKIKVLDAQDFSGQGDIKLKKAKYDHTKPMTLEIDSVNVSGVNDLTYQPDDSVYWMGYIDEDRHFKNSSVQDINNNGEKDDIFALITFPVEINQQSRWVYYIDEDADGELSDENPRFNYKYAHDTFTLKGRNTETEKTLLTFTINIRPEEKVASFHAADNAHGTHCAGIAAGYKIYGQQTLHGIAPGAQLISCKIGDATLSGGATTTGSKKKAFEYGIQWGKEHNVPIVFSMSYGIGSELEGKSDIEKYLNTLMAENENIVIVTSNGNEGPGISSTGNPAAAHRILSAGAMLPKTSARDSYGFVTQKDCIFHFSSRGGEVYKPDCLTPGAASSTVPKHSRGENFWGTSMACPQLAGAAAVLISACLQENIPFKGALIKRALKYSSTPLAGYTPLDQGTGIIDIAKAFEIMKMYAKRQEHDKVLDYKIETMCPQYPDNKGAMSYWRTGGYFPPETEKQNFNVKAIFPKILTADEKHDFYRAYKLKSDASWLNPDKSSTYIRANHSTSIGVRYQHALMTKPGLYVGKIIASPITDTGQQIPDFELLNTVIIPYEFTALNNYSVSIENQKLAAGEYDRYFVRIPPGASAMNVRISAKPDKFCGIYAYIFDPNGVQQQRLSEMDPQKKEPLEYTCHGKKLKPGIWEIIPFQYYDVPEISIYDLKIWFDGFEINPKTISTFRFENGQKPSGELQVINQYTKFSGSATGIITGYHREREIKIESDIYHYKFRTDEYVKSILFNISMDKRTWNMFTDIALNIKNGKGKIIKAGGMSQGSANIQFNPPGIGEYTLEIAAAFTYPKKKNDPWTLCMNEVYNIQNPISIRIGEKEKQLNLYPGIPKRLTFKLKDIPPMIPNHFHYKGEIEFKDRVTSRTIASVPVSLEND